MSSPDDMVGASAVNSYTAEQFYGLGCQMGSIDRKLGWTYQPFMAGPLADMTESEINAYIAGYEHGYAPSSVDSSPVTNPRSKPDESPAEP